MSVSDDLYNFIRGLTEDELRNLVYNYFNSQGLTYLVHGQFEEGADIILYQKDILGRKLVYLFQIKAGDIDTQIWRKSLHSQLYEMYDRELNYPQLDSDEIPRRIILIASGKIPETIAKKIGRMNKKNHIPIEWFDLKMFVDLLVSNEYTIESARKDVAGTIP